MRIFNKLSSKFSYLNAPFWCSLFYLFSANTMYAQNDACSGALSVATNGTPTTSAAVTTYTASGNNLSCDGGSCEEDAFYSFVAPASGAVNIRVSLNTGFTGTNTTLVEGALYANCANVASNTTVACFSWSSPLSGNGRNVTGLTPGTTYYLEVEHYNCDWAGTYNVMIRDIAPAITANTNTCLDLAANAFDVYTIGTAGEGYNCSMFTPEFNGTNDEEMYLLYTPTTNQTIDLVATNATNYVASTGIYIGIFTWTPGVSTNCLGTSSGMAIKNGATSGTISNISLTAGTKYVIVVGEDANDGVSVCVEVKIKCGATYTNTLTEDCTAGTYSRTLNFSSIGAATTMNITDGTTTYNTISTGTNYVFSYPSLTRATVTMNGYDGSNNLICSENLSLSPTCVADNCSTAIDALGKTIYSNSSAATIGGSTAFVSMGNGNTLFNCNAGSGQNAAYYFTDFKDLWYAIDIPDGATEFTVTVSNSSCNLVILPYKGTCSGLSLMDIAGSSSANSMTGGANPFISGNGSFRFYDGGQTDIATASTGIIYLRVMAHDNSVTNAAPWCSGVSLCDFDISVSSPQPNDACSGAINFTTNNGGAADTKNYSRANAEGGDEWNTCPVATGGFTAAKDLWYQVNYPASVSGSTSWLTELKLNGTAGQQVRVIVYSNTYACGAPSTSDVAYCETVTLTGSDFITSLNNLVTSTGTLGGTSRKIQIIPIGTVGSITASATITTANNNCDWFNQSFPGFGISSALTANFTYSTPSTSYPTMAGNDLWFQFDPNTGTDNGANVYSTSADITVSGLTSGQTLSLYLYKRHGSTGNCVDLSADYISQTTITTNTTTKLFCLDELHGTSATGDGYLLRIVQTAGTTASPTVTVTPSAVGPYNNDCVNIWDGNSPKNTGTSDAAHSYSAWHFLAGETKTGSFATATDCNAAISSSVCNGVGNTPATGEVDDKDVWFTFKVPNNQCATLGLTQSTVVSDMKFTYTANPTSGFNDARVYVYSDCGDANLVACSGVLDGANTAGTGEWVATGLTQGQNYLVRVKPASTSSNFSFNFNLKIEEGVYRPCNDTRSGAYSLPVNNCPNYPSLVTYSAQGADDEVVFGEKDVWFTFVAPSPANGNNLWFNINKSWVTVFLEGQSNHLITMELYEAGGTVKTTGSQDYSVNGIGDRTWGKYGNLQPGATYMIRLRHNQTDITNVQYKIGINAEGDVTPLGCGESINNISASLCGSCGGTNDNQSLCETWYKIDLPPLTAPNMYWVAEVRGFDQVLDFELRSQYITEASANTGGEDDYDHPCTSRTLEPSASLVSSVAVDYQVTAGGTYTYVGGEIGPSSCESLGGTAPYGGGFKKVYYNLNGPVFGQKDFYYIRVFIDPDDPQFANCATNGTVGINVCDVIFKGPYLTQAAAETGGAPNANFCTKFDYCDLSSGVYPPIFSFYTDDNEDGRSDNGVWLGNMIDSENASWGTGNAVLDDTNGDDEDGLIILNQGAPGATATFRVTGNAIATGTTVYFGMWIDWDNNGTLEDFYSTSGVTASPVIKDITVNIPASYDLSGPPIFVRLIASPTPLTAGSFATDLINGEVEGHVFAPSQVLPISLLSFTGSTDGKNNILKWQTATELNSAYFEVLHSKDAVYFDKIGTVAAAGNSQNILNYQFIDEKPLNSQNYYKLKLVDIGGSFKYSNIVEIKNQKQRADINPNPANDVLTISVYLEKYDNITVQLSDMNGKVLKEIPFKNIQQLNHTLDISNLPNGMYLVKIMNGTELITRKFLKQ